MRWLTSMLTIDVKVTHTEKGLFKHNVGELVLSETPNTGLEAGC